MIYDYILCISRPCIYIHLFIHIYKYILYIHISYIDDYMNYTTLVAHTHSHTPRGLGHLKSCKDFNLRRKSPLRLDPQCSVS